MDTLNTVRINQQLIFIQVLTIVQSMQSTCPGVTLIKLLCKQAARHYLIPGIILELKVCVCISCSSIWFPPEPPIAHPAHPLSENAWGRSKPLC